MKKTEKFSPEVRDRTVRMVFEHRSEYASQWAAVESIAGKIGCTAAEQQRVKALEREVKELRKANEILKLASAFFAQAELDRHIKR